jgi:small-conductance mechanosensitive channel
MFTELIDQISAVLQTSLFTVGATTVTLSTLLFLVLGIAGFVYLTKLIQRWLVEKLLSRTNMDIGNREATGIVIRYLLLVFGLIIILQMSGIDLTILNVLAGTLGIGVGFGLQNIVNNFVSGLIILFERPIKVGDRIEVGNVHGRVIHLGVRSATILTNDNVSIIIPNQKFVTENIINWSHTDDKRRFIIPVTVALSSDPYLVERLLLEAANEEPEVLKVPPPGVRLFWFGENGMHFELRAWSNTLIHRRGLLTSKLNFAIYDKFKANNVELVTPQREVFVRSESVGPSFE